MPNYDYLIYGSYFNVFLAFLKLILVGIASFILRPKSLDKLNYWSRVRVGFWPIENEEVIFGDEYKKLKLYRLLWQIAFALLFLRIVVANILVKLVA
jgi:hypothetical protein